MPTLQVGGRLDLYLSATWGHQIERCPLVTYTVMCDPESARNDVLRQHATSCIAHEVGCAPLPEAEHVKGKRSVSIAETLRACLSGYLKSTKIGTQCVPFCCLSNVKPQRRRSSAAAEAPCYATQSYASGTQIEADSSPYGTAAPFANLRPTHAQTSASRASSYRLSRDNVVTSSSRGIERAAPLKTRPSA